MSKIRIEKNVVKSVRDIRNTQESSDNGKRQPKEDSKKEGKGERAAMVTSEEGRVNIRWRDANGRSNNIRERLKREIEVKSEGKAK